MKKLISLALAACFGAALTAPAAAQSAADYPKKSIKIVVPFPAGGTSDVLARLVGQKLTAAWGQPVVIDNRSGANGNIGADSVAKSDPDGYTLLLMDMGNLTLSPTLYPKLPFSPVKDLAPVTMLAYSPHLLVTSNSLPVKSQTELVNYSKTHKGKLNFAAAAGTGSATHLAGVLFAQKTGTDWGYVPYRGGAQALNDLIGGQIDVTMNGMVATYPHVKAGKIKLLAVSSAKRLPQLPDVPTVSEIIPGFVTGSWQGVMAPAGTPKPIIDKLNKEMAAIVRMPDVREKMTALGAEAQTNSPEEFGAWMKTEIANWAKVISDANIKLD
jgi:tripartite-type tricarboxylate transporter receptor subunit TctC